MADLEHAGLQALAERVRHDLLTLCWDPKPWMPASTRDGEAVLDVAIVGAGQAGLAVAAALRQLGIAAVLFDQAPAGQEGPWVSTARMETLRSPKELTGPALGVPSLTFRAWYEAQFGAAGWAALDKIPRTQWMDYLRWFRQVMSLEVRNGVTVTAVRPRADGVVALALQDRHGPREVLARRVVWAAGRDGLGGAAVPPFVRGVPGLVRGQSWSHSSDDLDYRALKGLRVGVVGAGSSAMDSAATALECGAASVDLLIRRTDMPRINKSKAAGVPGLTVGHHGLPDAWKWRIRHYINQQQVPAPHGSTLRVSRHPRAFFHFGCPVLAVRCGQGALQVDTPKGRFSVDHLVVATGFVIDWAQRPALAGLAPHVRAWKDQHPTLPGPYDAELADSPYLGPNFEFLEKQPGACPGLDRVHCFCYPAALSHGTVSGDIPAISDGARSLARGLAGLFYAEDIEHHHAALQAYQEPELLGDEWVAADTAARVQALTTTEPDA